MHSVRANRCSDFFVYQLGDIGNFESYFKAFIDFAIADEKYGYMVRQYLKRKVREF